MVTVNIRQAKIDMENLIERVEAGEEVIITRWKKPIAALVPRDKNAVREPEMLLDMTATQTRAVDESSV